MRILSRKEPSVSARPKRRLVEGGARAVAVVAAIGCLCLWGVFLWSNPYRAVYGIGARVVASTMMVCWVGGLVATYLERFRWALIVFVVTFFPVGLYLLGTPGVFAWIGVLTLVYLAATVLWHWSRKNLDAES